MHNHMNEVDALERVLAGVTTADCDDCGQIVGDVAIVAGVLQTTAQHVPLEIDQRIKASLKRVEPERRRRHFPWAAAAAVLVVGAAVYYGLTLETPKPQPKPAPAPLATPVKVELPAIVMGPPLEPLEWREVVAAKPAPAPAAPERDARDLSGDGVIDAADAKLMIESVVSGDGRWSAGDAHALMRSLLE